VQSHNTARLAEVAQERGARVHRVDRAQQIDPAWLQGVARVGVTAGASAPPQLVDEVVTALKAIGATKVYELEGPEEKVNFPMPKGMQPTRSSFWQPGA
jgi:4-hydroxy-3-methylbut-2-enyl diphosphate reductase